jgi:hypothetical protein
MVGPSRLAISIRDFLALSVFSVSFLLNHGLFCGLHSSDCHSGVFIYVRCPRRDSVLTAMVAFYTHCLLPGWAAFRPMATDFHFLDAVFILGLAYLLERIAALHKTSGGPGAMLCGWRGSYFGIGDGYRGNASGSGARANFLSGGGLQSVLCGSWQLTSHLRSYFFKRSDLMRQDRTARY